MKKLALIFLSVFLIAWYSPFVAMQDGGSGEANTEIGDTTAGASESASDSPRMAGNSTAEPSSFTTPAGGLTVTHGYFYGNTGDDGSDGTVIMAIFNEAGTIQGACSESGDLVDGASPAWNEVVWATPVVLAGSTAYWVAYYPSELVDYYHDTVASSDGAWVGAVSCPTYFSGASTKRPTVTIANYNAH